MLGGGGFAFFEKAHKLLLPAIIWGSIYVYLNDISMYYCIMDVFKSGYWFSLTLFEFIAIQYVYDRFFLKKNFHVYGIGLLCLSLFLWGISLPFVCRTFGGIAGIIGTPLLRYYLYFVVGLMVRHYVATKIWSVVQNVVVSGALMSFVLIAVITWGNNPVVASGMWFHLRLILFELSALILVFSLFYKHREYFADSSKFSRIMIFIGRRTFDVYLLHYFFLPMNLHKIGTYFISNSQPVVECIFSGIITVGVVSVCLIASELLRVSSLGAKWLFGGR